MSDSFGITSWVYDARGWLVQESKYVNGTGGGTFVTQWGYDSADRMTQMFYPGGEGVNSLYNEQGLLRRMYTTGLDYVQSATYDGAGRVTQRVLGSSTVLLAEYTYFPWTMAGGRLQRMTLGTTGATTSLQDLTYSYDAVGNVKQQLSSVPWGASQKQCFNYDGLNRLLGGFTTAASDNCTGYTSVGNGPYNESYDYSPNGNLASKSSVGSYVYGASSPGNCRAGTQATKPHAVQQAGSSNVYSYDCNGNMTGRTVGGVTYTLVYDEENRLQQVKQGSTVLASYTNDADGNRAKAVIGSNTTVYVGAIYEKTTNGSSTTITKYYQAGGQRIALRVNGVVRWLATDHLGSTALTASETGGRLSEIRYKPWGESRYTFGATPTQRRFTGQVLDEVAGGLYFYNARYYDPALGRFASADTLVPQPQNPQNLNRYTYAANNSLRFSDPSGHAAVCGTSVDGGCGTTPPRSSRPVIVPLPAPTPPLGTPTPGQVTANQGGTANSWSWDALFSPDTMVTLYKGEGDIRDYAFGFVNTREGYSIYKVVGRNGQEYWVAAGSAAALRRIGLNPGVANSSRAMNAIRAAGRGGDGPFLLAGGLASVGPNLIAHAGHGDFFSKNTVTDLIVDTGGWAFSEGVGLAGAALGAAMGVAPLIFVGEVVGSVGGSVYWDNKVAPGARARVRMWLR